MQNRKKKESGILQTFIYPRGEKNSFNKKKKIL
jgi:hypothetical protein